MIELKLGVNYADGRTDEVLIGPVTQVAFEDEFGVPFVEISDGKPRMSWLYWLVWHGLTAAGRCAVPFDAWLGQVGSLGTENVEEPGPLDVPL